MSEIIERFQQVLENPKPPKIFEFKAFLKKQPISDVLKSSESIMIHKDSVDYLNQIYQSGILTVEQMKTELDKVNRVLDTISSSNIPALSGLHNSLQEAKTTLEQTIQIKESDEYLIESTISYFEKKEQELSEKITNVVISESYDGPTTASFNLLTALLEAQFGKELVALSTAETDEDILNHLYQINKIVAKYSDVTDDSLIFEASGLKDKARKAAIRMDEKSKKLHNKIRKGSSETKRVATIVNKATGRVGRLVTNTLSKLKEMDDDARRRAVITGGLYKRSFKILRTVVVSGALAYFSSALALIYIVVSIALDKRTDARIRDAILTDLETEINIIEEKIRDADSSGDKKAKYQLMRLKAKLEKEVVRIKTNNRHIKPMNYKELKELKRG